MSPLRGQRLSLCKGVDGWQAHLSVLLHRNAGRMETALVERRQNLKVVSAFDGDEKRG